MSVMKILFIFYGLILLSGAYFGWKAGSQVSLIAGLISGILVFIGIYLIDIQPSLGYGIILATSALLSLTFLLRFLKTHKFMPSGLLLLASLIILILTIRKFLIK